MLSVPYLREHREEAIAGLKKRGLEAAPLIDKVMALDEERKAQQLEHDGLLAEMNRLSKSIGELYKAGKRDEAEEKKAAVSTLKEKASGLEAARKNTLLALQEVLEQIPNVPHETVAAGQSEKDNVLVREGKQSVAPNQKKPHWEIAKDLEILDFELGNVLTGSGFPVFRGKGARLQRALISYFLDQAQEQGYEEVMPPLLVNADSAYATGQLPDKEGQMYTITEDQLYLIPTAEVPITNMYRGRLLEEKDLPRKHVGYTPCFRREAGSYGKDVRGLNRVHQFDKVEIVQLVHPEHSYQVLDEMVNYVETLVQSLELPYRIVRLCGGDLGFTSALTYDFEVYAAAQDKWLEVSSVSNFDNFQSQRLNCRFRDENKKKHLVHTLNGSALALPRIMAALLENHQDSHGIVVPDVLRSYTGFDRI